MTIRYQYNDVIFVRKTQLNIRAYTFWGGFNPPRKPSWYQRYNRVLVSIVLVIYLPNHLFL